MTEDSEPTLGAGVRPEAANDPGVKQVKPPTPKVPRLPLPSLEEDDLADTGQMDVVTAIPLSPLAGSAQPPGELPHDLKDTGEDHVIQARTQPVPVAVLPPSSTTVEPKPAAHPEETDPELDATQAQPAAAMLPEDGGPSAEPDLEETQAQPAAVATALPEAGQGLLPEAGQGLLPEGGYGLLPELGERSRSGEHVTVATNTDPRRVVAAAFAVGVLALFAITTLVTRRWVSPSEAWIWFGGGMLAATLLTSSIVPWEPDSESRRLKAAVRLGPGIAGLVVGLLASAIWAVPAVRTFAVSRAGDDVESMRAILIDPSDVVSGTACRRFIVHFDDSGWWRDLYTAMSARPGLASTCLEGASPEVALSISQSLSDRWSRRLSAREAAPGKDEACRMANGLVRLPISVAESSARLLDCVLSSESEDAQFCCSNALAGTVSEPRQWARRLIESATLVGGDETPSGVFAMAFYQQGLTAPQKEFASKVGFDGVEVQGAALSFVCESMSNDRARVVRYVQASLDAGDCPVEVSQLPQERAFWTYVCNATVLEIEADRTRPAMDTLCEMTLQEAVPRTIETARRFITAARTKPGSGLADTEHSRHSKMLSQIELTSELDSLNLTQAQRDRMMGSRVDGTVIVFKSHERRKHLELLSPKDKKKYLKAEEARRQKVVESRRVKKKW